VDRILSSWSAIKMYFLNQGEDNFIVIALFIKEQENEMGNDLYSPTMPELYLYFVSHFLNFMCETILLLEKNDVTATELHDIMIDSRSSNTFFGAKVNACLKDFNSFQQNKFIEEALEAYNRALSYLNKFYDFNGSRLQYFCALIIRKYD
jgi:hypothetical protein